ncbi:MAG: uracil-DNA glycosylase [Fimbriimonadaceae bacterium]
MDLSHFDALNREIVACERCPRLRAWCKQVAVEKRKSFLADEYWGKPVPNFGDPSGNGLIVGLAPAAHGANRTGRMFTGDRSGEWLFRAMFRAGLASRAEAVTAGDGLELKGCVITASCHCAPPDNKPTVEELGNCRGWLEATWGLREWRAVLCLGGIAWKEVHGLLGVRAPKFGHGVEHVIPRPTPPCLPLPTPGQENGGELVVLGSYHPSQQNTFTGRLTESMLDDVMGRFGELCL